MGSRFTELSMDGHDLRRLADFWCEVLGYRILEEKDGWIEIGQGEQTWVVMADPEGNEFCVLRSLQP
jgi:catechol-2,3-dioxygenase